MELRDLTLDYVALFLFALISIWYLSEKNVPLRRYFQFMVIALMGFVATILEIAITNMMDTEEYGDGLLVNVVMIFYNMVICAIAPLFLFYVYSLVKEHIFMRTHFKIFFHVYVVFMYSVFLLNPIFEWAFEIKDGMVDFFYMAKIVYAFNSLLLLYGMAVIIANWRHLSVSNVIIVSCVLFACLVCSYYQLSVGVALLNYATAVGCLVLYHYLQNPSAMVDEITGLFNRKFMNEYVDNLYNDSKEFSMIVVAMDDFKFVNKTYGTETGDMFLYQISSYIKEQFKNDISFRYDSDQFCIIHKNEKTDLTELAKKLSERFRHPWYSESSAGVMLSASICLLNCPDDAKSMTELIEVIDYSITFSKKTKKGGISRTSEFQFDAARSDKAIEKAVKLAMDREELKVYYQPIFSVEKGKYNSAEALVRLNDEELGWISPEIFIPIAEKNGLIIEMGEFILESVCKFIHDKKISETSIEYIEVNISPIQLMQIDFADRVKRILEKYHVNPLQINMEITETANISTMNVVNENINKLVEYGIKFSLDDYGSGHSNIDYINRMPFSLIKIDKYIIWDAFDNEKAGITLEYTIGMLNALKLYIVAEGVETDEMREKLESIGCHYMQGWLYSKAVPPETFAEMIQA